jgi:hypothetical protein
MLRRCASVLVLAQRELSNPRLGERNPRFGEQGAVLRLCGTRATRRVDEPAVHLSSA